MPYTTITAQMLFRRDDQRVFTAGLAWIDRQPTDEPPDPVGILHPDELRQYQAYKGNTRRFTYLAGRLCAKKALAQLLNVPQMPQIHIDTGIFNQPIVKGLPQPNWRVSISHDTSAAIAVAFSEAHPVSVDIESLLTKREDWEEDAFTAHEQTLFAALGTDLNTLRLVCWTTKESLSKVLQTGLMLDLNVLSVDTIRQTNQYYWVTFRHFFQYQAAVFIYKSWVISILFPVRSVPVFTHVEERFR
jgi:phosphopantetheinyl transferase